MQGLKRPWQDVMASNTSYIIFVHLIFTVHVLIHSLICMLLHTLYSNKTTCFVKSHKTIALRFFNTPSVRPYHAFRLPTTSSTSPELCPCFRTISHLLISRPIEEAIWIIWMVVAASFPRPNPWDVYAIQKLWDRTESSLDMCRMLRICGP
jgi:hypothetical protein